MEPHLDRHRRQAPMRWIRDYEGHPAALPIGPNEVDRPYWDGLRIGELRLQRCTGCRAWIWEPRWICPRCHCLDLTWESVEPIGRVYSWTRTWTCFPGAELFDGHTPYVVLLVELPDADATRVLGLEIDAPDCGPLRIGDDVRGVMQSASASTSGWSVLRWERWS